MAIDPVCKMTVDGRKTSHKAEHMGGTYYFCSSGCTTKFEKAPEKYIEGGAETKEKKPWWRVW